MNKRGFELAINTLVIIVLGVLILAALTISFTMGWQGFWNAITGYSGGEIDNISKLCQTQCNLNNVNDFCCGEKMLNEEEITCQDERLDVDCSLACGGICGECWKIENNICVGFMCPKSCAILDGCYLEKENCERDLV